MRKVFVACAMVAGGAGVYAASCNGQNYPSLILTAKAKSPPVPPPDPKLDSAFAVANARLARLLELDKMKARGVFDGVQVYAYPSSGESVYRTGRLVIDQPPNVIADLFGTWARFKDFDAVNTTESREVRRISTARSVAWFRSAPKWMISPRDFIVLSERVEKPDGTIVFTQMSNPTEMPPLSGVVRADIWTLMHIQPIPAGNKNATSSLCTYGIDIQPHGWLITAAVDLAADDIPLTLAGLKKILAKEHAATV